MADDDPWAERWEDMSPAGVLRVFQQDGGAAWSSPIWAGKGWAREGGAGSDEAGSGG